jgi:anti-anti-sigma factor
MFRKLDRRSPGRPSPQAPVCGLRVQRHRDWTAVLLRGELDLDWRQRLERRLSAELERGKPLIVELAGLDFIDVSGLRALQRLVREGRAAAPPVEIELHGARGQVARLIERLGLESLLEPAAVENEERPADAGLSMNRSVA